jgi:small subunit ribosomal protein S13
MLVFKVFNTIVPLHYNLAQALCNVYGIGLSRAFSVLSGFGLGSSFHMNSVNSYFYNIIVIFIKSRFILDFRLKELYLQRLEFFFEHNFVKGIRVFNGLPCRGQRTHTNSSTMKLLKPFSEKFNDIITERNKKLADYAKRREKKRR